MKKILFLPVLLFTALAAPAQDYWVQLDSVNGAGKSVCAAFTAQGEGYVVSGMDYSGFMRKMYSYNPAQDDWDNEQSIGGADGGGLSRGSACAFSINEKGYITTGQGDNTNYLNDTWEYDPVMDLWTQKANFPGTARRGAVAFVIDNIAYVGTGEDATGKRKDFYKFDPLTNLWGTIADFGGSARRYAVGFTMGGQGYVGTGDDGVMKNDFWQYLVFQNMWVQKANFPGTPRMGACGWGAFPNGYIATGEDNTFTYRNDLWEYNYFTNQWTQRATVPGGGRKNAIAFTIGNIAYLGTGYNGDFLDDFYGYVGITGVNENENLSQIRLYPNPAIDQFTLSCEQNVNRLHLKIYGMDGRDLTNTFSVLPSGNAFQVSIRNAVAGMYNCVLSDEKGNFLRSEKLIIGN